MDRSIAYVRFSFLSPNPRLTTLFSSPHSQLLRWTAKKGPWPTGDPDLQHYVGELLYKGAHNVLSRSLTLKANL